MTRDEKQINALIDQCAANIESGNVNSFASYDEGVKDALLWVQGGDVPYIGRE